MGLFAGGQTPPPPPPLPPAAPPPTIASGQVQTTGAAAKARSALASGAGFSGTDMTGGQGLGAPNTAAPKLLGG